jgi:hypothetical protein
MSEQSVVTAGKKTRRTYTPYTALTLDADYCVCTYGDAAYCLFGYPEVTMLGKHVSRILPALLPDQKKGATTQEAGHIQFSEVRMQAQHADGNTFSVMVGLRQDCLHGTCRHLVLIRNLEERPQV